MGLASVSWIVHNECVVGKFVTDEVVHSLELWTPLRHLDYSVSIKGGVPISGVAYDIVHSVTL